MQLTDLFAAYKAADAAYEADVTADDKVWKAFDTAACCLLRRRRRQDR